MNIEKLIPNEFSSIGDFIDAAQAQYNNEADYDTKTANVIPPDYHVLFILVKNISANGQTYTTTSTMEAIFNEAVKNFKGSVEFFTHYNVNIVTTTKVVSETVSTSGTNHYLIYENVYDILKKYSSVGLYDAVIVVSAPTQSTTAVTTLGSFSYENIMHGFSHVKIMTSDSNKYDHGYPNKYPHLLTTNFFIHEWMHQLQGYKPKIAEEYPDTHGYQNPTSYGYSWNDACFDDPEYEHIVEPYLSSYYRAVLSAEVLYNNGTGTRYIGMYPLFWKLTPRKLVIGRYLIQNSAGNYYFNNNGNYSLSATFTNEMTYVWNVYYSLNTSSQVIRNFGPPNATLPFSYTDLICTRVGPYDEGEYCLINLTLSDTVLGYTSSNTLNMVTYRSNTMQTFNIEYYSELYFWLKAKELSAKYLDLNNNNDYEDNSVGLFSWTGNPQAQTWQYRFNGTSYKIMPKKSPTRSLSFHNGALHITSASNIQNWRPELISNGKFIHEGTYKIKTAPGQYLTFSGNTLKLASSGTIWKFTPLGDNYYSISVQSGSTTYYFDVLNPYDIEGNIVQVQYATGYADAQSWKLMLKNNGSILIVPRVSLSRGIKSTTSGSTLSTSPTSFYLVKV